MTTNDNQKPVNPEAEERFREFLENLPEVPPNMPIYARKEKRPRERGRIKSLFLGKAKPGYNQNSQKPVDPEAEERFREFLENLPEVPPNMPIYARREKRPREHGRIKSLFLGKVKPEHNQNSQKPVNPEAEERFRRLLANLPEGPPNMPIYARREKRPREHGRIKSLFLGKAKREQARESNS